MEHGLSNDISITLLCFYSKVVEVFLGDITFRLPFISCKSICSNIMQTRKDISHMYMSRCMHSHAFSLYLYVRLRTFFCFSFLIPYVHILYLYLYFNAHTCAFSVNACMKTSRCKCFLEPWVYNGFLSLRCATRVSSHHWLLVLVIKSWAGDLVGSKWRTIKYKNTD